MFFYISKEQSGLTDQLWENEKREKPLKWRGCSTELEKCHVFKCHKTWGNDNGAKKKNYVYVYYVY